MTYDRVFTDVVKDVIGDDPVLDQFDVYYEASFYRTMQDDYVTGSMINEVVSLKSFSKIAGKKTTRLFTTGTRGVAFSKYYSDLKPPVESTLGSTAVSSNPTLSYRLVPNSSRVSTTAYRFTQCYDSSERYYDSCVPDFSKCTSINGAIPWELSQGEATRGCFSPYRNVKTGSVGFLLLNGLSADRSKDHFGVDPLVDNDWTWSFPYEPRYSTVPRIIKTTPTLGVNNTALKAQFGRCAFTETTSSMKKVSSLSSFVPILPGRLKSLPEGARNSFRAPYKVDGIDDVSSLCKYPASVHSASLDVYFGTSFLVASDVDFGNLIGHGYISDLGAGHDVPNPAPATGSMTSLDLTKFLFGFGDLNNITYANRLFLTESASSSYMQGFQDSSPIFPMYSYDVERFDEENLKVDWTHAPKETTYSYPWSMCGGGAGGVGIESIDSTTYCYYEQYVSGALPVGVTTGRIRWVSSSVSPESGFLRSAFPENFYGGAMNDPPKFDGTYYTSFYVTSSFAVDVTSSYPWHLRYKRVCAARTSDFLDVFFAGVPEKPSGEYGTGFESGYFKLYSIESVSGAGDPWPDSTISYMEQYDSKVAGLCGIEEEETWGSGQDPWYPFPAGPYRIVFQFNLLTGSNEFPGNPSFAAMKDFEIVQYPPEAFPPDTDGPRLGSTSYPDFKSLRVDPRMNPEPIWGSSEYSLSGSADRYKGMLYGISPTIRGWKYGLVSGLPTNTKAVFRRDRFGQLRDMLEQRQYTKFVMINRSPVDDEAIVKNYFNKDIQSTNTLTAESNGVSLGVVEVNFVKQTYKKDDRGIGYIYNESVDPSRTVSQNFSVEATSSLPFFDGVPRHRTEEDLKSASDFNVLKVGLGTSGFTVS